MLDWLRKPKADKPADDKGAASKPSEAVPKPPAAAGNASAPVEKPSGTASVPNDPAGKAAAAHQVGHAPQNVRHEAGGKPSSAAEKAPAAASDTIPTAARPISTAAEANPSASQPNSSAARANSTAAETISGAARAISSAADPISTAARAISGTAEAISPAAEAKTTPATPTSPPSAAPDRPAKLPPNIAESGATVFIPREEVKLQAPTIAVTVPASAVVSAPADKVKTVPPETPAPGRADLPVGQTPASASEATRAGDASKAPAAPDPKTDAPQRVPTTAPAAPTTPPKPATWKNLPAKDPWCPPSIAAQAPELRKVAAADAVAFERVLPGWRAAGASRRGRMHANGGTHREDSLAFDAHDRATVLCVSDGAGSCQHSRIGSHVAAHRVVEMLLAVTEKVDPAIAADATKLKDHLTARVTEAVLAATDALLDLAKKSGCAPKDFRCTLLTALHYRGEQHELLLTNQIGDGAICLLRKDLSTARLGASDSGTHSGEVSCFVPDDCARVKAKAVDCITPVEPIECVLLCSDGIEDPFYPLEKQAADIFRQYYAGVDKPLKDFKSQPPQPAPLLQESAAWGLSQWLEFEKRGENDDRTVAVLHRLPQTISF